MKLTDFAIGKSGVVIEVLDNPVAHKLAEFGIIPGAQIKLLNKASFNGPLFIQIGMIKLALRASEATSIIVA